MVIHFKKYTLLLKTLRSTNIIINSNSKESILYFASDVDADPLSILHSAERHWNGPLADKYFSWFERLYRMHTRPQFSGSTEM